MSKANLSKRALSIEPSLTLQISAKANQLAADGVDICNLSAGEPDFDAPKAVSYTHLTLPTIYSV